MRVLLGSAIVLAVVFAGGSTASAQKGKGKQQDQKQPPLAEAKGVTRIEYSPDGTFVLADYRTGKFRYPDQVDAKLGIWDAKTGAPKLTLAKPPRTCERIAISPDNKKVAAISVGSKQLKIWDAASGKVLDDETLPAWKGSIQHCPVLRFASDGTLYGVRDKQLFEVPPGGKFKLIGNKMELFSPEEMAFDPAAKRFILLNNILGRPAGEIRIYDATKGGEPQKVPTTDHVRAVALSPDGKTLATSYLPTRGKGGHLEFWDTTTWKKRSTAPYDTRKDFAHYGKLAFSPDGKTLAGAPLFEKRGNTQILDILDADGKVIRGVTRSSLYVLAMAFSPDGKTLALILSNNSVMLIDPATGEEKKP